MKSVKLIPPAASLFESMRDWGYTLDTALADIIDNSITANSNRIDIIVERTPERTIGIIDNGHGMSYEELLEAMRYASRDPRDVREKDDLGRFGLGLKLASLSQCKRLTLVSKKNEILSAGIWDQDHVDKTGDWDLLIPDHPADIKHADKIGNSGTLVLWEKIDTLETEDDSADVQQEFTNKLNEARSHLELIFHRFLEGEPGLQKCNISLNNNPLVAYEPFNKNHPATQVTPVQKINNNVVFQVFTLPHHSKVSKSDWSHYGGRDGYLKNQGLYIYREKRLIIHGTWLRITRQTELNKLTRVKIDITNSVDSEWGITTDKSTAKLPSAVRTILKNKVDTISSTSKRVYTGKGKQLTFGTDDPAWKRFQNKNEISYEINPANPVISKFFESMDEYQKKDFTRLLNFIGSSLPIDALYADSSNEPTKIHPAFTDEDLEATALITFDFFLEKTGDDVEAACYMLKRTPPFDTYWEKTEMILTSKRGVSNG